MNARLDLLGRLNAALPTHESNRGLISEIGGVEFATGAASINTSGREKLAKFSGVVASYPALRINVEGHTDNTGSNEGNVKLSQERADAIKTLLVSKGITPERIVAKGYGSQYPQVANATPEGRQANRRVEIVVLNEGVSPQSVTR